jgi:hypothetical protein
MGEKPQRRRYGFRLRTLVEIIAVVAFIIAVLLRLVSTVKDTEPGQVYGREPVRSAATHIGGSGTQLDKATAC